MGHMQKQVYKEVEIKALGKKNQVNTNQKSAGKLY